ncbi:MAG: phosphatidylinositol kinase [Acidobacterium ailaaui]|jgi:hypothetical protein|nr:phosphatidylinositol kinase [Pseudacidobacterium ailaaui]MCL6464740.1 phosphatidylinositol kinase [Pseudacidobacterium ailaaui]MDI3256052.1 phosphatidylinositol kinase [Bacillota bacterium]
MMVTATQVLRKMRGETQSFLLLCSDGHPYIVKFQNNPQHPRVLANEWFGALLMKHIGLPIPDYERVLVSHEFLHDHPELNFHLGQHYEPCQPGVQFGSRLCGGLLPGTVVDYLPEHLLLAVTNLSSFAGALAFDRWTGNADGRQAVFVKVRNRYQAIHIDQGMCFNGGEWRFKDAPLRGAYARNVVYRQVTGWHSFEPWLTRIEECSLETLLNFAFSIPPEWFGNDIPALERLVHDLDLRRSRVRDLILEFRYSSRQPFPNWP